MKTSYFLSWTFVFMPTLPKVTASLITLHRFSYYIITHTK